MLKRNLALATLMLSLLAACARCPWRAATGKLCVLFLCPQPSQRGHRSQLSDESARVHQCHRPSRRACWLSFELLRASLPAPRSRWGCA